MQTPRHRLPHDVAVLTSSFSRGLNLFTWETSPRRRPCHTSGTHAPWPARPPGVTLRLNTTLSASLTTDRTSPLTVNHAGDAGDGSPDPGVRQAWPRRPRLLHPDPQRVSVGPSQDFWETRLPPWDAASCLFLSKRVLRGAQRCWGRTDHGPGGAPLPRAAVTPARCAPPL